MDVSNIYGNCMQIVGKIEVPIVQTSAGTLNTLLH